MSAAEDADWQQENSAQELEYPMDGDPKQPERQQQKPYDRVEDKRKYSERPAKK